jgi:cbb3-type cytochrome oxidase subunit 3
MIEFILGFLTAILIIILICVGFVIYVNHVSTNIDI